MVVAKMHRCIRSRLKCVGRGKNTFSPKPEILSKALLYSSTISKNTDIVRQGDEAHLQQVDGPREIHSVVAERLFHRFPHSFQPGKVHHGIEWVLEIRDGRRGHVISPHDHVRNLLISRSGLNSSLKVVRRWARLCPVRNNRVNNF